MADSFYMVDDDISIINMLTNIITEYNLGTIKGFAMTATDSLNEIFDLKPDIILLDYLLPDKDGLEIIQKIQEVYNPIIIMISEVSDKTMISKAYRLNIDFFITKPINVIEVVSIIKKSKASIAMKNTISHFEKAFAHLNKLSNIENQNYNISLSNPEESIKKLFGKLGIIGESGSDDLESAILWTLKNPNKKYKLSELYSYLSSPNHDNSSTYAIEQRIRRTISKSFNTMASIGLEDFFNPIFEDLGSHLFEFTELRKQMNFIKGKTNEQGKINIKKFIEGACVLLNNQ